MAVRIKELEAVKQPAEPTVEQVREQRLADLQLKKLTAEQVETIRDSIDRNRPVYEALRDR